MNKSAYTAASAFPEKLLKFAQCRVGGTQGVIRPLHVQIAPTNRCNLTCEFCSCAKRGVRDEMDTVTMVRVVNNMIKLGTQGVTITGGGEPLLYPHLGLMTALLHDSGVKMGLVTNGIALRKASIGILNKQTWCRISVSDDRDITELLKSVEIGVCKAPDVDWAFSYVVTKNYDMHKINRVVAFANQHNFTHVRLVSDLMDLDNVPDMEVIKAGMLVNNSRVIFQGRKEHEQGQKKCWISLLKPVVAADGKVYPCCGVQYAKKESALDFDKSMVMGTCLDDIHRNSTPFDGSDCVRCYYGEYNRALDIIVRDIDHKEFV